MVVSHLSSTRRWGCCAVVEETPCTRCGKELGYVNSKCKFVPRVCAECKDLTLQETKECSRCNKTKPLADFDKDPNHQPNYHSQCRACQRPLCLRCKKSFLKKNEAWDFRMGPPYCSDKCRFPPCARRGCQEARPTSRPDLTRYDIIAEWFCRKHR